MSDQSDGGIEHSCPRCGESRHVLERGRAFLRNRKNPQQNETTAQQWKPMECPDCGCVFALLEREVTEGA